MNKKSKTRKIKVVCSYCSFKIEVGSVVKDLFDSASRLTRCPKCRKFPALQKFYE